MEELFGDPAYKGFVLQDKKRLPARFLRAFPGALTSRLTLMPCLSRPLAAGSRRSTLLK